MVYYICFCYTRCCIGGNSILNKKYLLYGLGKSNKEVKNYFNINNVNYCEYIDNINNMYNLDDIDFIVKSPGIKPNTTLLKDAALKNIKAISDLELCYLLYKEYDYILITGSNGKTTTCNLVYEMLKYLPYFKDGLCGNIGMPIFSKLLNNRKNRGLIVEASSFMLHNTYSIVPSIYVVTNILPHHLDFHESFDNYIFDKTKIISNMSNVDYLIYNLDDIISKEIFKDYNEVIKMCFSLKDTNADIFLKDNYIIYKNEKIINVDDLNIKDDTVIMDMMISILVSKIYHIPKYHITKVLKNFRGISYRLEKIYDNKKLIIYNDSKSTSPYSLYFAVNTVIKKYENYKKVLIVGGAMIDDNYEAVNKLIGEIDEVYLYGKSKYSLVLKLNAKVNYIYDTIEEVVNNIKFHENLVILYSPSCVSYDQFSSYEERGKKFNILIDNKLKI